MKRNDFIKTLAVGTGVLATGISFGNNEPDLIKYTLEEIVELEGTQIYISDNTYDQVCYLHVMFFGITPEKKIIITDVNKSYDSYPEDILPTLRYVTVKFDDHTAMIECLKDKFKKYKHGTIQYQLYMDTRGYMSKPYYKDGVHHLAVQLKFEIVNSKIYTYMATGMSSKYRLDGVVPLRRKKKPNSLLTQITQPFKEK